MLEVYTESEQALSVAQQQSFVSLLSTLRNVHPDTVRAWFTMAADSFLDMPGVPQHTVQRRVDSAYL